MASDATPDLTSRIPDIEDMDKVRKLELNNLGRVATSGWEMRFPHCEKITLVSSDINESA